MSFEKFIDIVLNMRTTNVATVKDVSQSLKVTTKVVKAEAHSTQDYFLLKMTPEFARLRAEITSAMENMAKAVADAAEAQNEDGDEGSEDPANIVEDDE